MNDPAVQGHMHSITSIPYIILPLHVPFTLAFKVPTSQPASQPASPKEGSKCKYYGSEKGLAIYTLKHFK